MLARRPLAEDGRAEVQTRLGTSYRVFSWGSSVWFVRQVRGEDRPSPLGRTRPSDALVVVWCSSAPLGCAMRKLIRPSPRDNERCSRSSCERSARKTLVPKETLASSNVRPSRSAARWAALNLTVFAVWRNCSGRRKEKVGARPVYWSSWKLTERKLAGKMPRWPTGWT